MDDWVAEVTQARSALSQTLSVHLTRRPAFRLAAGPSAAAATTRIPSAPPAPQPDDAAHDLLLDDAAQKLLLDRVAETDRRSREAQGQLSRLTAELEFAREQLHIQNRLRAEADAKWAASEREREATVHELGRAQISLDEMRRQLRGKEWALENAKGEFDLELDDGAESLEAVEEIQREATELRARLDALTADLQTAREHAQREQEAAAAAEERRKLLEQETQRSREIVEDLSREVERYAEQLRQTGRELDEARAALESGAGVPALDDIALKLQLAERRNTELSEALDTSERVAHERLSETIADSAVLSDNFDALAASHMELREAVSALQQELIARDHELARLKSGPPAMPAEAGLVPPSVLEELESNAIGQDYLVQALRRELDSARGALESNEMDHRLLARALRGEIESLRSMAAERDFVIHHQGEQLDAAARAASADTDEPNAEALHRELLLLRQRVEDKDAIVKRLRGQLAETEARVAASVDTGDSAELRVLLEHREADLQRTRDRVDFLRRMLRDLQKQEPVKQVETAPPPVESPPAYAVLLKQPETRIAKITLQDAEKEAARFQANASLQREVEQSLAFRSAWPFIAIAMTFAGLGLMGLAALAFMLI